MSLGAIAELAQVGLDAIPETMEAPMTVYTPRTLAKEWGCSERHVRNLIQQGELPAFRAGHRLLRITKEAVEEYQNRSVVEPVSDTEHDGLSGSKTSKEFEWRLPRPFRIAAAARSR